MMKSRILYYDKPIISSFPSIAATMIALQSNIKQTQSWIYSHYIQLVSFNTYYEENWPMHIINFMDAETASGDVLADCPVLRTYRLPRSLFFDKYKSPADYVKQCISNGYYMQFSFNQKYNHISDGYHKSDFMHPVFVYGFDEQGVYMSDFVDRKGFVNAIISFDDFEKGVISQNIESDIIGEEFYNDIQLFRIRNYTPEIDINFIKTNFQDYYNGTDSTKKYASGIRLRNNKKTYGLSSYDTLIQVINYKKNIDLRPFHILHDHKQLMCLRMLFFSEKSIIPSQYSKLIIDECNELAQRTTQLRNYAIMRIIKGDTDLDREKIINKLYSLKLMDKSFVNNILNVL